MRRDKKRTDNFPHERTDKLLDELEAENKRLREALERILATVHQPNLNDPLKVWHVSAGNGMAFSQAINNAREALDSKAEALQHKL